MGNKSFILMLAAGSILTWGTANAAIIADGSALNMYLQNFPGCTDSTCTNATTFGTTATLNGGSVTLTTEEISTGPNGAWDLFDLKSTDGSPIGADVNGNWSVTMDYTLSAAVNFDAVVNQWVLAGDPLTPTSNFGGICCASDTNPVWPGGAYYNSGFSGPIPAGTVAGWQQIFIDPYSFLAAGGVSTDADEFRFALHFTLQQPVPELSTWAMMLAGFGGLGAAAYRRSRKVGAIA